MPTIRRAKTAFTAGELAPDLLGRGDVAAWAAGARRLRNVFILPTGGVTRRPGLRHLETVHAPARLVSWEVAPGDALIVVLRHAVARILRADGVAVEVGGPWTGAMLPGMSWTASHAALILLHPDMPPQTIRRAGTGYVRQPLRLDRPPCLRFADTAITLSASAATGTVTLTASAALFVAGHVNARFRIAKRRVRVTAVANATTATAEVEDAPVATAATTDWDESAFSDVRGWPATACHYQGRLVLAGARDAGDWIWMSRTGNPADFDPGEGLDDQGIAFPLRGEVAHGIRAVFPGRHLQAFTSAGEWMITGDPVTPSAVTVARQTRVGSRLDRNLPPLDVDGATVFAARSGQAIHEFSTTAVADDAYQANDLGLVARHLIRDPVAMAYDPARRLLHAVTADGAMATLTLYRAEGVTGWTRQETDGAFRDVAESGGTTYVLVERGGTTRLERFDDAFALDAAVTATGSGVAYAGLGHLEGRAVSLLGDGTPRGLESVSNGRVTLEDAATIVQAGLPFAHVVEPLPPDTVSPAGARTGPVRLVAATFRVLETGALSVDLGRGAVPTPLRRLDMPLLDAAPPPFTGDVTLRALGWHRDSLAPLWRVEGDAPLPMTLLSVTTETRTTD